MPLNYYPIISQGSASFRSSNDTLRWIIFKPPYLCCLFLLPLQSMMASLLHPSTAPPPPVSRPHLCISPGGDLQLIAIQRAPSLYIHLIDGVNGKDYQITDWTVIL